MDFLSRDERVWSLLGAHRLLSARCIGSILQTVERLHKDHGLALATLDVHAVGLDADFQGGFLQDFNLHHEYA